MNPSLTTLKEYETMDVSLAYGAAITGQEILERFLEELIHVQVPEDGIGLHLQG